MRKDGADDDSDSGNFRDKRRSNDTHVSNTGADARLYCKGDNASRRRVMGHPPSDNRHGLVANAMVTTADGFAEREAAKTMIDTRIPQTKMVGRGRHEDRLRPGNRPRQGAASGC